jgi:ureidoacrylate peracid hydrolase
MVDFAVVPERMALLNIDMQNCFVEGSPIFFLSDGTATSKMGKALAAELQKATLATLGFLFAQVLTVNEMIEKIRSASS